jgi:hypothetical protein
MTGWSDLERELDLWAAAGQAATFWWRDDDAIAPSPALDQLLALARKHAVVPMLAVIPARAVPALSDHLRGEPVVAAQHGYTHANHAWRERHKAELGPERAVGLILGELSRGALQLDALFGSGWLRVIVPPYNRIAPAVIDALPTAGYAGLSGDGPRRRAPQPGFIEINTHVDIMDWKARTFGGEAAALGRAMRHLAARREGKCDRDEPTGLLTHHLAHDADAWTFVGAFLGRVRSHRAARWLDPREAWGRPTQLGAAA